METFWVFPLKCSVQNDRGLANNFMSGAAPNTRLDILKINSGKTIFSLDKLTTFSIQFDPNYED